MTRWFKNYNCNWTKYARVVLCEVSSTSVCGPSELEGILREKLSYANESHSEPIYSQEQLVNIGSPVFCIIRFQGGFVYLSKTTVLADICSVFRPVSVVLCFLSELFSDDM